jgi:hypothetical protein
MPHWVWLGIYMLTYCYGKCLNRMDPVHVTEFEVPDMYICRAHSHFSQHVALQIDGRSSRGTQMCA